MGLLVGCICWLLFIYGCSGLELDIKINLPVQDGPKEFIFYSARISWNEALLYCEATGGVLAKIDSDAFQERLIDAFTLKYGTGVFSDDYWTGLFQPFEGDFRWASDCSQLYYSSNIIKWTTGKMCFKFSRTSHWGQQCPCSENHAFICEKSLAPDYPCGIREIFAANSLGTSTVNQLECAHTCEWDPACWMYMFTPPYGCVKLAYNTANLVQGVKAENSPIMIAGKFCMEVTQDNNIVYGGSGLVSDIPILNCSDPDIIPAPVPVVEPLFSVTPTPVCTTPVNATTSIPILTTETVTTTLLPSCSIHTVTEIKTLTESAQVNPNIACATETVIITATPSLTRDTLYENLVPSCAVETTTVIALETQPPCIESACDCTPGFTSVLVSASSLFAESSSPLVTSSTVESLPSSIALLQAMQIAEELSQNLTVNLKSTSAYQRKLSCMMDYRPSSTVMGYLGMVFVFIPLILIVLLDVQKIFSRPAHYQSRSGMVGTRVLNSAHK